MAVDPKTLQEAVVFFADPEHCRRYIVARRWPKGVTCPRCGGERVIWQPKYNRWQCGARHDRRQFTVKTGTVMEDSPIGLDKWLLAIWLLGNCKDGISSYKLYRAIGVTQKTAWFMLGRIRLGMQDEACGGKIGGPGSEVEIDETRIGGRARNMQKDVKDRRQREGRNTGGKTAVLGMLEPCSTIRAVAIGGRTNRNMQPAIRVHVSPGSELMADEFLHKWAMPNEYYHNVVNHLETYVDGNVHCNGAENFWSLLKRALAVPTFPWDPITCSATLTNRRSNSTTAGRCTPATASATLRARSSASS